GPERRHPLAQRKEWGPRSLLSLVAPTIVGVTRRSNSGASALVTIERRVLRQQLRSEKHPLRQTRATGSIQRDRLRDVLQAEVAERIEAHVVARNVLLHVDADEDPTGLRL